MNLRLTFAIAVTKLLIFSLRILNRGGTTLPGKVAQKIYPGIIKHISKYLKIIMVTGTNGKTTTTGIISKIMDKNKIDHITNKSGANLVSGIITTLIDSVNLKGKSKCKTALIEVDEAAFNVITNDIKPDILVVTNFFKDQLDRFGKLDTILNNVKSGIEKSPEAKLILNADDPLCVSLAQKHKGEIFYYGFDENAYEGIDNPLTSDVVFCIYCMGKYEYKNRIYGHLGTFTCTSCGYSRPSSHVTCLKIDELNSSYTEMEFSIGEENYKTKINLPGLYNVYNALAAISLAHILEVTPESIINSLKSFESTFGRMETIKTDGKAIKLILVKNPAGFNQVINFLLAEPKKNQIAFLVNDKPGDGIDVSWLWDVDFEEFSKIQDDISCFYASGSRAEDMALRLKYAGIYSDKIEIIKDYEELINKGLSNTEKGNSFYILPTYTALLDIRGFLKKKFKLKEFWK
ncbi:Mur ligase family protein [Acetivibrio saccincola]|jgi:UDP-N-acetylmuramyl tripeptide synthase|uniref:Lipid II isoglutaminyl synthase (glutamine-hydrolyzing) subunit MurT n=1 Tax=Acetivibrio saccincola TaxID=1677857 RepID=A0A2K9E2L6_9FIRM|nr:Mur ligase family protein [Acetivibrio saccincola]AUG57997.1 UDP-N-acetylmuramate--L-alanine ligase [Acetivibrio saccincola]NLW28214.1 Mur ligase family protein [Acetivibrio saccincola]PQQ67888.1 UDP-N-acetylmuramyl tripeptide ligase-like protein [Acetivibrio saccincola]HQD29423.1 Mur ligase family protein [Acetivibrio saccincola]